jgi:hypothetical protein
MTASTRSVREQGFEPLACDIPADLTIAEYRSRRRDRPRDRRRNARSLLSRLIRR